MRVNVKKTKTMISSENTGKVTIEGKFPCAVCRKGVGSNSIPCQFCRNWVQKRCSDRDKLKEDNKCKCKTCANQHTGTVEDCPDIEIVEKFCYFGNTIGAGEGAFDSDITVIRGGWCKFRDLVSLLASRGLPLGGKGRLDSASERSVMLYGRET